MVWILLIGLLLFLLELVRFVHHADRSIDLRVFIRLYALVFMWIAPAIAYLSADASWYTGYRMAVPADVYFKLVIPGTLALNLALSIPVRVQAPASDFSEKRLGWALLGIGLGASVLTTYWTAPAGLRHVLYLSGQLWLAGVLFLGQAYPARRWWLFGGACLYLLGIALESTLFGYSLIWCVLLFCYTLRPGEIALRWRWAASLLLALGVLFLLSFKYEYRQQVWHEQRSESKLQIFLETMAGRLLHPSTLVQPAILEHLIDRLNQGYHTASTMAYVPEKEPFARGATLLDGLRSALLPRFLAPDKARAGGAENIRRFAGISGQRWSSNIGHYGEAYVNFGIGGAWLLLLAYGLLISGVWYLLRRYFALPWWPFVLQGVLNVEEDIGMALNHLSKGLFFVAVVVVVVYLTPRPPLQKERG